jgi:hypothetical protein
MGSDTSKRFKLHDNKSVGNLSISLTEEFYYPNQEVKGTVCIDAFQDILVYGLDLKFFLNEFWKFEQNNSNQTRCNEEIKIEFSINIINTLKPSSNGEESYLPKGFYNLPFSFKLPESLQPSFEFRGNSSQIQLRYAIYCCLMATKGEKYCLSNLNYLIIRSPPKALTTPLNISNMTNVHSWIFFNKGLTILAVSYPKNNYKFAEPIELRINICNSRGKLNVEKVKIRVIQKITFRDQKQDHNSYENNIQEKIIPIGVEAGKSNEFSQFVLVSYDKMNSELYQSSIPYSQFVNNTMNILKFQPSIETDLIKCEYSIKISLYFDSFVSYDYRPRITMPLWISHKTMDEGLKYENNNFSNIESKHRSLANSHTDTGDSKNVNTPSEATNSKKIETNQPKENNPVSNFQSRNTINPSKNNNIISNLYNHFFSDKSTEEFEDINSFNYPLLGNKRSNNTNSK